MRLPTRGRIVPTDPRVPLCVKGTPRTRGGRFPLIQFEWWGRIDRTQQLQVHLMDDVDGAEARETVRFGLDGIEYAIDLTGDKAATLRAILSGYTAKGRRVATGRSRKAPLSADRAPADEIPKIRQWAKENGYNPSLRGRLTQSIIDAYRQQRR